MVNNTTLNAVPLDY